MPQPESRTDVPQYVIEVNVRHEYGQKRYYPANKQALAVCSLKGRTKKGEFVPGPCLFTRDIEQLKALGFQVVAVTQTEVL